MQIGHDQCYLCIWWNNCALLITQLIFLSDLKNEHCQFVCTIFWVYVTRYSKICGPMKFRFYWKQIRESVLHGRRCIKLSLLLSYWRIKYHWSSGDIQTSVIAWLTVPVIKVLPSVYFVVNYTHLAHFTVLVCEQLYNWL